VQYALSERLHVSASVLDLGKIGWRSHVENYSGRNTDEEFTYAGVDVEAFFSDTSGASDVFQDILDTLESAFDIGQDQAPYKAGLPTQSYFGIGFTPREGHDFQLLAHTVRFGGRTYADFAFSYCRRLGKWFAVTPGITLLDGQFNPGLGTVLSLGSFQCYLVSDNLFGVLYPQRARHVDVRAGINFVVGRNAGTSRSEPEAAE
jgi:hypothetical protein